MGVREYIGARYVPQFANPIDWNINTAYEPLTIVYTGGNSYTSRQYVPAGVDITNNNYWALTGNYNAQIEAYRNEVQTFNGRIATNTEDISALETTVGDSNSGLVKAVADNANDISTLESTVGDSNSGLVKAVADNANNIAIEKTMHVPAYTSLTAARAYINTNTGNDETGELGNPSKPYATINKAINDQLRKGSIIDITFQNTDSFNLPYSVYVGTVIHFRVDDTTLNGAITLNPPLNHHGDYYFYDSHVNFIGKPNCPIIFNCDNMIEIEGSTLYTSGKVIFNCDKLNLVQGSASFSNVELNGQLSVFFAYIRANAEFIVKDNVANRHAIYLVCSNFRAEVGAFRIKNNIQNVSNMSAFYALSCNIFWNDLNYDGENLSYNSFLECRGCTIAISDEALALLNTKCANASQIMSVSLRWKTTVTLPS